MFESAQIFEQTWLRVLYQFVCKRWCGLEHFYEWLLPVNHSDFKQTFWYAPVICPPLSKTAACQFLMRLTKSSVVTVLAVHQSLCSHFSVSLGVEGIFPLNSRQWSVGGTAVGNFSLICWRGLSGPGLSSSPFWTNRAALEAACWREQRCCQPDSLNGCVSKAVCQLRVGHRRLIYERHDPLHSLWANGSSVVTT